MAKTIRELAEDYSSGYMNLDRQLTANQACVYGANAVIEEIESIAFSDIGSYKNILDRIQNKIKELKGLEL